MKEKLKYNIFVSRIYFFLKRLYNLIRKFKNGIIHTYFILKWIIIDKREFYRILKSYGFSDINIYKMNLWKSKNRYFTAIYSNKKVFIKSGGRANLVEREVGVLKYIEEITDLKDFVPKIITYNYDDRHHFIAEEFINGTSIDNFSSDITLELFLFCQKLYKYKIHHQDIRPDNFLYDEKQKKLILIDFGFSFIGNQSPLNELLYVDGKKILKNLGSNYNIGNYVWDDAYSFFMTIKKINPEFKNIYPNEWYILNELIGKSQVRLVVKKNMMFFLMENIHYEK